jgi:hypothetical protein
MQKTYMASERESPTDQLERFKAWAMRLPREELAAKFAELLAKHLLVRRDGESKERNWKEREGIFEGTLAERENVIQLLDCVLQDRHEGHSKGGQSKDPEKQKAKAGALALWIERHDGKRPDLRTNEMFAAEVMDQWPVLESSKNICTWCTKWSKEVKDGKAPTC